ncbi:uncharacterized mitochondrial membrane protein Fmp10p [[Candida] jaroonii]|uniref:Uncharacterized mitochondrial membrane protein Fmp10p n=1 Tax=[Candida] jaroonii TaxID=467808 RepID=A0ACA9Y8B5_9ASCO|nr:uncharacterized mitochondrial membrane protein Fmp10p [[Candida] jaroonii]
MLRRIPFKRFVRSYAVRSEYDSPFDYLPKNRKKPFISWKATLFFIGLGSYISYSEVILDRYAEFTEMEEKNDFLPIKLKYKLTQLPIYQKLMKNGWTRFETWEDFNHNILDHQNFTKKDDIDGVTGTILSHTLSKPGGFLIKPVIFAKDDETVTLVHAGYRLCGYPFIVHGGIIATMLNETFKRNAALSSFTKSGYKGDFKVENISINYKYPSFANQFLIIKTKKIPMEGENDKLIKLETIIENEGGKILVKSQAVLHDTGYVSKSSLKKFIGL